MTKAIHQARDADILKLVGTGLSYDEVAKQAGHAGVTRNVVASVVRRLGDQADHAKRQADLQAQLKALLAEGGPFSATDLAARMDITPGAVARHLGFLSLSGDAVRVGKRKDIVMWGPRGAQPLEPIVPEGVWTEPEVAKLRELAADDVSSRDAAVKLGRSLYATRRKAWALGIVFSAPMPKPPKHEPRAGAFGNPTLTPAPAQSIRTDPANGESKALRDLQDGECRWPLDAPDGHSETFLFCAAPIDGPAWPGCYCAHHRRVMRGVGTESERSAHRVLERAA
jgi:hypothetical protein